MKKGVLRRARRSVEVSLRGLPGTLAAAALLCLARPAAAAGWAPESGYLQFGQAQATEALIVGAIWPWEREWPLWRGVVSGYWEVGFGRWSTREEGASDHAWVSQFGVTPVFRYRGDGGASAWFVELGIGANVITPTYRGNRKHFETAFNFGDHIAVGFDYGARRQYEWSLRYQHFSNAGIKEPNPGENFIQLRHAWHFD